MKRSLKLPLFFMIVTIGVISIFQVYWLKKTYQEEKHLFGIRTNLLFRETIMRLQAAKLHLDSNINIKLRDKEGILDMTNILQEKFVDSASHGKRMKTSVMITMDAFPGRGASHDSNVQFQTRHDQLGGPVFDFLAGVDSLRDSISIKEISEHYAAALSREKIGASFIINSIDTLGGRQRMMPDIDDNRMVVGFVHPKVYEVNFPGSGWWLVKKMWQQFLVSFLLLGITIGSFLLMYRNLRRQQKLTQFKNDFISNITHELKTPIATVSVAIEALKNFNALQDPQRTREYLDISGNEMQRLGLLVDKVLKLSLYEKQEITLGREPFNLVSMAEEVVASMKLQFEKQDAAVSIETSGHNFIIEADRLHMTSVLYNLLDNALKYSKGKPVIQINITDHTQYLEMTVSDNGIGIAPEYRYKIFEQFFRVPGGNRHNIKGYGLGLSYVNHIVRRHQGFVEVKSKLNEGSSFSVMLPFKEAPVVDYGNGRRIVKKTFKIGRA
jgi:two-component system phosphate regulon sensor histidine kinase PhoR